MFLEERQFGRFQPGAGHDALRPGSAAGMAMFAQVAHLRAVLCGAIEVRALGLLGGQRNIQTPRGFHALLRREVLLLVHDVGALVALHAVALDGLDQDRRGPVAAGGGAREGRVDLALVMTAAADAANLLIG